MWTSWVLRWHMPMRSRKIGTTRKVYLTRRLASLQWHWAVIGRASTRSRLSSGQSTSFTLTRPFRQISTTKNTDIPMRTKRSGTSLWKCIIVIGRRNNERQNHPATESHWNCAVVFRCIIPIHFWIRQVHQDCMRSSDGFDIHLRCVENL